MMMMMSSSIRGILLCTLAISVMITTTAAFAFQSPPTRVSNPSKSANLLLRPRSHRSKDSTILPSVSLFQSTRNFGGLVTLRSVNDDDDENNGSGDMTTSSFDQLLLGGLGTCASLVTFYSEYTLFTTGCGLPAGPFGLVGLIEGLSYLGFLGIFAYSVVTKIRTVRFDCFVMLRLEDELVVSCCTILQPKLSFIDAFTLLYREVVFLLVLSVCWEQRKAYPFWQSLLVSLFWHPKLPTMDTFQMQCPWKEECAAS